ncbi:MAG: hypothetical protein FWF22_01700 [Treponema sp.]|nr:hypothetical protein [Treponema sp.]
MANEKSAGRLKFPFNLSFRRTARKNEPEKKPIPRLKLVLFIVDWNNSNKITEIFAEEKVRFHFIFRGRGTANSEILDLLGIGSSDKAVIICLEQEILIPVLFNEVRKKLGFYTRGAGIAFTIPLSGINTPLFRVFKESINKNEKISAGKTGENMEPEKDETKSITINNDLVVAIINQGFSDEFMTTAREAGASGGTVINARGLAHEGPVKFFGISVNDEKEIVLVLTSREKKIPIMEAVSLSCGIASKAEGIIFSLPVDKVMGLNLEQI